MRAKINDDWKFHKGDLPATEEIGAMGLEDKAWQDVNIPHDFTIEGPVSKKNFRYNGFFPKGIGWYQKHLELGQDLAEKQVYLEFEGVFRKSTLWINGKYVGRHMYGYTGVVYDITPYIRSDGQSNVLTLKIDNPESEKCEGGICRTAKYPAFPDDELEACEGWWYEGCGIYRNVWLITVNKLHVKTWGTFVTTPEVSEQHAEINIRTTLQNKSTIERSCILETVILDPDGKAVAESKNEDVIAAGSEKEFCQEAGIDVPLLWSPDEPHIYMARSRVISEGKEVDSYETPFGIRWFEFTADRGFFLNGKHLQLCGVNIHHDFGGLGVALPDRAHEKNVEVLKAMGCNIIRSAHNDAAPALMDACDRLGMLMWAETRYLNKPEIAVPPLRDLIRRSRNHPSIICWSLANTAGDRDGVTVRTEYLKVLNDVAHEEDSTRPTSFACEANADADANGFAFVTDIVGYNGTGMNGKDDRAHKKYPDRRILITEGSGVSAHDKKASNKAPRGNYEEVPGEEAVVDFPTGKMTPEGTAIYAKRIYTGELNSIYDSCYGHERGWSHVASRPWLAGGMLWTGIEYYGESKGWPNITSQYGFFDVCRFSKDTYYFYLQEWTHEPMVHIFPHWNWHGKEGKEIDVWCYTNCESVELFLNGKSLGSKPCNSLGHIEWKVPYEPGTLLARASKDGKIVCSKEIRTAGEPAVVCLEPDRSSINADAHDLSFITASLYDEKGVFVPTADNDVTVDIKGCGRLLGLANGNPRCHDNPKTNKMKMFNGLLLAVVQNDGGSGDITATASSPGIKPAEVKITAKTKGHANAA